MLEQAIQWFNDRKGRVTYSMVERNGPSSYDCSSAEYHALIFAGIFPSTIGIGNTDTLFGDLERHGFSQVTDGSHERGDVFIWGERGNSAGGMGHTGQFIDGTNIIHCSYGYNGIAVSPHDWLRELNGNPPVTFYRLTGAENSPTDQIVEPGSWVKFNDTYRVDDIQMDANIWQIKTNALCSTGFTWDDNGIPAALVTEVDGDGFATTDQELAVGSLYKIPGKFNVLDVGQVNGEWLAQIGTGGMTFWVDIATATEIGSGDPGVGTPSQHQTNADTPPIAPPPVIVPPTIPPTGDTSAPPVVPVLPPPVDTPVVRPDSPQDTYMTMWDYVIELLTAIGNFLKKFVYQKDK